MPGSSNEAKVLPYREKGMEPKLTKEGGLGMDKWCQYWHRFTIERGWDAVLYLPDPDDATVMRLLTSQHSVIFCYKLL